ncbi:MAG: hypothetical protein AAGA66_06735 [Bacteroidota bacterium]
MRIFCIVLSILTTIVCLGQTDDAIDNQAYNRAVDAYNDAKEAYEVENYTTSLEGFKLAHELNPNNSDYVFGIATSYYGLEVYDSAEYFIESAINLAPRQADYHYRAGNIYFHQEKYFDAFKNYTMAINYQGRDDVYIDLMNCQFNRGVSALYSRLYEEAIKDFTEVLTTQNTNINALHMRGVAYTRLNRMSEACTSFTDAYNMGHPNSKRYLDKHCQDN